MGVIHVSYRSEVIDVSVSRQVLWVGTEAYPLQNIARAQIIKLVPDREAVWRRYQKTVVSWVFLGVAATVAIALAPRLTSLQSLNAVQAVHAVHAVQGVAAGVLVLGVVLVVISTIRLTSTLSKQRTFYALVIETAGSPRRALVSTDENLVIKLVHKIMDAVDNPDARFHYTVENFVDLRGAQGVQVGGHSTQDNTFNPRPSR